MVRTAQIGSRSYEALKNTTKKKKTTDDTIEKYGPDTRILPPAEPEVKKEFGPETRILSPEEEEANLTRDTKPAENPNPEPMEENPLTASINQGRVDFQPNGRVKATDASGNTYDFSPVEWKATMDQAGGLRTAQVNAYLENQQKQRIRAKALRGEAEQRVAKEALSPLDTTTDLSQVGNLPPEQQMQRNTLKENALTAGLNVGAIGAGVATGAGIGAVGGPVGAVIGGVVGGAGVLFGKLSIEARQDVKTSKANFDNAKGSLGQLRNLAITNPELKPEIIKQWNDNLVIIRASEKALREQNKNLVGKKLADNLDELADIEQFYRDYALLYEIPFKQTLMQS